MKNWTSDTLGNLIHVKHGFAFKGELFTDTGKYLLLTPGNVYPRGGLKLKGEKEKFYSGKFPDEYLLKKGDLIIVMTDLTQDASILGGALLIDQDDRYLHNQRLGLVTIHGELDKNFLYYYLNWQYFRDQVKASSNGATVKHTAPERIYKCKIGYPDIPTQRKIAAILTGYDDLIENNKRRIALLEKMPEEIYREWFVRFRFPGYQTAEFEKGIPKVWEVKAIKEIVDRKKFGRIYRESELYDEGDVIVIDQSRADSLGFYVGEPEHVASADSPMILFGDHTCKMVLMMRDFSLAENVIPFLPKDEMPVYFLFHLIKDKAKTTEYKRHWTELTTQKVLIPDPKLQADFSERVVDIYRQIESLKMVITNLTKTRELLLPRLISGKLSVADLDIQFPPSMSEDEAA